MFLDENASVREQKVEPMMVTSGVLGVLGVALGHSGPIPDTRLWPLRTSSAETKSLRFQV